MFTLIAWCHESEMRSAQFGKGKIEAITEKLEVSYREIVINARSSYKYLGVQIDSTIVMQEHFTTIYTKA